jgi:hypothetical protein
MGRFTAWRNTADRCSDTATNAFWSQRPGDEVKPSIGDSPECALRGADAGDILPRLGRPVIELAFPKKAQPHPQLSSKRAPVGPIRTVSLASDPGPFPIDSRLVNGLMGSIVLVRGSLKGMGLQAECEVLARRLTTVVTPPTGSTTGLSYSECSVIQAPVDLPDGDYVFRFKRHAVTMSKKRGAWLSHGPATIDDEGSISWAG